MLKLSDSSSTFGEKVEMKIKKQDKIAPKMQIVLEDINVNSNKIGHRHSQLPGSKFVNQ